MFQYLPRRVNGSLHRISDFVLKKQAPSDRTGLIQMEGFSMSIPNFALCLEAFMPAAKLYALIICIVPSLCLEYTDRGQVPSPKTLQSDICQKEITGQSDPLQVPTVFLAVSVVDLQIIRQALFTPPLPADCRKAFDSLIGQGVSGGGACNLFATRSKGLESGVGVSTGWLHWKMLTISHAIWFFLCSLVRLPGMTCPKHIALH